MIPVALSLLVTFESSILMLGFPAEVYVYGIMYWLSTIGLLLAFIFGSQIVPALFHPLKITSVYQVKNDFFPPPLSLLNIWLNCNYRNYQSSIEIHIDAN